MKIRPFIMLTLLAFVVSPCIAASVGMTSLDRFSSAYNNTSAIGYDSYHVGTPSTSMFFFSPSSGTFMDSYCTTSGSIQKCTYSFNSSQTLLARAYFVQNDLYSNALPVTGYVEGSDVILWLVTGIFVILLLTFVMGFLYVVIYLWRYITKG